MFSFFKKKERPILAAVVDGVCIPLEEVKDPVFSEKALGDGVAFIPEGEVVVAPCDGTLTMLMPSLHAFGMACANGLELMVHIGIDTVELDGEGFEALAQEGAEVKKGQPIVRFDRKQMKEKNVDMTTMLLMINHAEFTILEQHHGERMEKGVSVAIVYK